MDSKNLMSQELVNIINTLEQIEEVKKMIDLHKNDTDDLMISQYTYRRERLLSELKEHLRQLDILPTELAA